MLVDRPPHISNNVRIHTRHGEAQDGGLMRFRRMAPKLSLKNGWEKWHDNATIVKIWSKSGEKSFKIQTYISWPFHSHGGIHFSLPWLWEEYLCPFIFSLPIQVHPTQSSQTFWFRTCIGKAFKAWPMFPCFTPRCSCFRFLYLKCKMWAIMVHAQNLRTFHWTRQIVNGSDFLASGIQYLCACCTAWSKSSSIEATKLPQSFPFPISQLKLQAFRAALACIQNSAAFNCTWQKCKCKCNLSTFAMELWKWCFLCQVPYQTSCRYKVLVSASKSDLD